ncbi:MAG: glycoside hydrolase family 97 catalytic domain-containing protein [Ignavibacteriae bacterium]|nr:glycoside hydrolase family 97 catalytic domain-containing protein [Ignavibacteriota bacterium]
MKTTALLLLTALTIAPLFAQTTTIDSPDHHIGISLQNGHDADAGSWFMTVSAKRSDRSTVIIPRIALGLSRSDLDFSKDLRLVSTSAPTTITEDYTALHGKRSHCTNSATEIVATFENVKRSRMDVRIRVYNDGITFRYEFLRGKGSQTVLDELTSYEIPHNALRWLERWTPGNENLYSALTSDSLQQDWGLPALFCTADTSVWFLIHEADLDRNYCGTKLSNRNERSRYKVTFPDQQDGPGPSTPTITLPWHSPWRTVIMGSLADVTASTLIDDVSRPSILRKTDWIRPGLASWNYWSHNHGTRDFKTVCEFTDLAVTMGWPYTLFDWEWDAMTNGGDLEDAVKYARDRGITPLMWYNGGVEPWATMTPIDRMRTHENRIKEFAWLRKLGVAGVKVDFIMSEKQEMIRYYLDILEDAAQFEIMVYFHGCLVPRGWTRTYPHLMTYEGVRGAEWYNNGPDLTTAAPQHNAILPFTRNVIGPMDYTPVTFTNSQYPHTTSFGHELALGVVFESGIQHMADRPAGYLALPDTVRDFLKTLPCAWDDTQLLDAFPGRDLIMARRHGDDWYIGGLNAEQVEKSKTLTFPFLPANTCYTLTLIADGAYDSVFDVRTLTVERSSLVDVRLLRRGGFAARLTPLK